MKSKQQIFQGVLAKLIEQVDNVVRNSTRKPVIIAIDGNCGSGKTTYSSRLATLFSAPVIHCDDFFLPKEMRTQERLEQAGGNIHYERLRALLARIRNEQPPITDRNKNNVMLTYRAYNCSTDSYKQRTLWRSNVVIVEGSYALHPFVAEFYDLKILLKVDAQTQYQRLLNREGEQGVVAFVNKWIPLENKYFDTLDTTDCVVIDTAK